MLFKNGNNLYEHQIYSKINEPHRFRSSLTDKLKLKKSKQKYGIG